MVDAARKFDQIDAFWVVQTIIKLSEVLQTGGFTLLFLHADALVLGDLVCIHLLRDKLQHMRQLLRRDFWVRERKLEGIGFEQRD